ncbi:hypothetical protein ATANTOWER_013819 [Ataeniobius toweri]|uniref:Uncharacterized protein n=1 Tax=Ataeniobius toweri TaxID=208326 RepID=A0ABU7A780_9TELE|nr:hypothetical protein [Ataeniobius toweri]
MGGCGLNLTRTTTTHIYILKDTLAQPKCMHANASIESHYRNVSVGNRSFILFVALQRNVRERAHIISCSLNAVNNKLKGNSDLGKKQSFIQYSSQNHCMVAGRPKMRPSFCYNIVT